MKPISLTPAEAMALKTHLHDVWVSKVNSNEDAVALRRVYKKCKEALK